MTAADTLKRMVDMGPKKEGDPPPNALDIHIARTQANVTYGYMFLFGGIVLALIFMRKSMDPTLNTLLVSLSSVLGTIMVQQSSFWFARQRTGGIPADPTTVGPVKNIENVNVESSKEPAKP